MKKNNKFPIVVSEEAIFFINKYIYPELKERKKIDEELLCDIIDIAIQWELLMCDDNGEDIIGDYPNRIRNEMADRFIAEISGDKIIDFDDLNKRLGLL